MNKWLIYVSSIKTGKRSFRWCWCLWRSKGRRVFLGNKNSYIDKLEKIWGHNEMSLSTPPCPFNFSVCLHDINFQGQKEAKCELISMQGSGREQLYDNKVALNSENLQTPSMFLLPPVWEPLISYNKDIAFEIISQLLTSLWDAFSL